MFQSRKCLDRGCISTLDSLIDTTYRLSLHTKKHSHASITSRLRIQNFRLGRDAVKRVEQHRRMVASNKEGIFIRMLLSD